MNWMLDLGVILVLLIGVAVGSKRGAVKTVLGCVSLLASVIIAGILAEMLAEPIFNGLFREKLTEKISESLMQSGEMTVASQAEKLTAALPKFLANAVNLPELIHKLQTEAGKALASMAKSIVDDVVAPVAVTLIKMLLTVLLFVLVKLLLGWIIRICDLVAKLPLLKQINGSLGGLLGFLQALFWLLLVMAFLRLLAPALSENALFSPQNVEQTVLFRFIYQVNPVYTFLAPAPKSV